jgi:hypothetical protein
LSDEEGEFGHNDDPKRMARKGVGMKMMRKWT